jgi:hypothetical protein
MRHARIVVAWSLVSALVAPLGTAAAAEPPGAATPQALVTRLQNAAAKSDIGEMMACMAPDDRREMAIGMVAGVSMMAAFMGMAGDMAGAMTGDDARPEDKAKVEKAQKEAKAKSEAMQKKIEAVLKKHGVDKMMEDPTPLPQEPAARSKALATMFKGTDDIALIKDLMALLEEVGKDEGKTEKPPVDLPKEITDLKVTGETATAKAGEETLQFVRVEGRWYMRAPEKDKGEMPGT